ncbi:CotH kinase family protein [Balneolales bacterium ANBcel1]|nr:CotH kinase family protein [Balneolales bacterium ANBcel1]
MRYCYRSTLHKSVTSAVLFPAIIFILLLIVTPVSGQQLYLNEIMASNGATIADEDGDNEDWVEIYYAGEEPLNLEGFGLSDDYDRPFRWEFPDITIQPGEFLLVWASNKDRRDPDGELHTNFAISSAGEEVILTAPDGQRLDELPPTEIPTDISIGRYPDGIGDWYFYAHPTPGEPNGDDGYQEMLEPVSYSHQGGFYTGDFQLELSHPDPDVTIIYTLDGSEPDPNNLDGTTWLHMDRYRTWGQQLLEHTYASRQYNPSAPIEIRNRTSDPNHVTHMQTRFEDSPNPDYFPNNPIFKGTVVRAKAVRDGAVSDGVQTHSYFVTPDGRNRFSLPVISFAIQEDHLFDYETGIYVPGKLYDEYGNNETTGHATANYTQRGIEWERPASMELFEPDSDRAGLQQDMGVRLHGGWSRSFSLKSFRLYARNQYGDNRFYYRMFPDQPYEEFNRLMLRSSGNDFEQTMFRDAMMQRVVGHMNFDTQAYRPFITLINGEYWGMLNLRERYDKHYLARVHGVDPENIDLLEHDEQDHVVAKEGSADHYLAMMNYIADNDITLQEHYDEVNTRMDIENYIDYQVAQIFVGNADWPNTNLDMWRLRTDEYAPDAPAQHDGRWRWLVYDLDFGFWLYSEDPDYNTLQHALFLIEHAHGNSEWSTELFRSLLENEQFRNDFINRFLDQLNTAFRSSRVIEIINEMAGHIEPDIAEHIQRWNRPTGGWGSSGFDNWHNIINNELIPFALQRPGNVRNHLREHFNIDGQLNLTVDISDEAAGHIRVNTIDITPETAGVNNNPYPWTGSYFRGVPVTVKAKPAPGFAFVRWEGVPDSLQYDPNVELTLRTSTRVTAVFEEDIDSDAFPEAFRLQSGSETISFSHWAHDATPGSFPNHMGFVYMDTRDPGLEADISGFTSGSYSLESRTRINGFGDDGFAFINTGNEDGNPGYPGTRLGGAILALDTRNAQNMQISWEGMTVTPNSRVYHLRLQFRFGDQGPFTDLLDSEGNPVEYRRNEEAGHTEWIGPITLPEQLENRGYVQLLWRYYFTGQRLDDDSGARDQLSVRNIVVEAGNVVSTGEEPPDLPASYALGQNYPNPFNPSTSIRFDLPESGEVRLEVYDLTGRRITTLVEGIRQAGTHHVHWDATGHASGIYLYRLEAGNHTETRKMTLIK